jgi:hypothetical protein
MLMAHKYQCTQFSRPGGLAPGILGAPEIVIISLQRIGHALLTAENKLVHCFGQKSRGNKSGFGKYETMAGQYKTVS